MFADYMVTSLNALYLAPMAVLSVVGTATLVKLSVILLRGEPRRENNAQAEVEDA